MQIKEVLSKAILKLKQNNINSCDLDAKILLQHAANISLEIILLNPEFMLSTEAIGNFYALIERRIKKEPVAKIIGKKAFWNSDFFVNQYTLDPRPDSEIFIDAALKTFKDRNKNYQILDLGTGSGCLILSLLQEFPNAHGTAVDISSDALEVAKYNAKQLKLENRVKFLKQNWADGINDKFDLIVSNPPYIETSEIIKLSEDVKNYDPLMALDGGADGLDPYRYLAKQLKEILKSNACIIMEFGYDQGEKVKEIFKNFDYNINEMLFDLSGKQRAIIVSV